LKERSFSKNPLNPVHERLPQALAGAGQPVPKLLDAKNRVSFFAPKKAALEFLK
jgi:hypothetical protein